MRTVVLILLILLPLSAYASTPILEDEALACVNGGTPARAGDMHTISFSNGYEMDVLRPATLASMVVLKVAGTHSAVFKVNGAATQTIDFSFKGFPDTNVCFSYDKSKEAWSISRTVRDMCFACSLESLGH